MNIRELATKTETAERQIRYLIAEGFMPSPRGPRSRPVYGDDHVAAIQRYNRLRDLGFPPAAIRILLESKEGAPIPVAPGVTLVIDPDLLGSGQPAGPILARLKQLLPNLLKDQAYELDHAANDD